jgi:hypothetical protein
MPAMGEPGSSAAAGLTVSFAPMTSTTSVSAKSSLISSSSSTMSYGTLASASSTFMARQAPGDGMDAEAHLDAPLAQPLREVGDRVLRLGDGHAVAGVMMTDRASRRSSATAAASVSWCSPLGSALRGASMPIRRR